MLNIVNKPECENNKSEYKDRDFLLKIAREEAGPEPKRILTREQYAMAFSIWSKCNSLTRKEFDKLFKKVVGVSFIDYSKNVR